MNTRLEEEEGPSYGALDEFAHTANVFGGFTLQNWWMKLLWKKKPDEQRSLMWTILLLCECKDLSGDAHLFLFRRAFACAEWSWGEQRG